MSNSNDATTGNTSLQTALSPSGKLLAVLAPTTGTSIRVWLYPTTNSNDIKPQATLVYNQVESTQDCGPFKLCWQGETYLALITRRTLVVWDLARGVTAYTFSKADLEIHDIGALESSFFILVTKAQKVHVYQLESSRNKLTRKIKVGKVESETTMSLAVTSKYLAVSYQENLRVLDMKTGDRVHKLSHLHINSSNSCLYTVDDNNNNNNYDNTDATNTVLCLDDSGANYLCMQIESGNKSTIKRSGKLASNLHELNRLQLLPITDNMLQNVNKESSILLFDAAGELSLLTWSAINETKKKHHQQSCTKQQVLVSWTLPANKVDCVLHLTPKNTLVAVWREQTQVHVATQTLPSLNLSSSSLSSKEDLQITCWDKSAATESNKSSDAKDTTTSSSSNNKRKSASDGVAVIGPAKAGKEAAILEVSHSKKSKTKQADDTKGDMEVDDDDVNDEKESDLDDDDDEDDANDDGPTIAERLHELQQTLDEEEQEEMEETKGKNKRETQESGKSTQAKPVTTESLTKVVQQALQSNDSTLLETALTIGNAKVIQETVRELNDDELSLFLVALTARLATRPQRAHVLSVWISTILKTGRVQSLEHLQPLRNLLQDRLEIFPALLKLEGRLSMMGSL